MQAYNIGTRVEWKWGRGHGEGKVAQVFRETISKVIKGKKITRHGSNQMPAYLIKQENGAQVLKLHSELHRHALKHGWA